MLLLASSNFVVKTRSFSPFLQRRTVVHAHYAPVAPRPPPRQYEPDGTLKRYRTNAVFYDHGIGWVRWWDKSAGVFHLYYAGEFAEEFGPRVYVARRFSAIKGFSARYSFTFLISEHIENSFDGGLSLFLF